MLDLKYIKRYRLIWYIINILIIIAMIVWLLLANIHTQPPEPDPIDKPIEHNPKHPKEHKVPENWGRDTYDIPQWA